MKQIKNIFLAFRFSLSYFSKLPSKIEDNENINNTNVLSFSLYFLPLVGMILSSIIVFLYQFFYPSIYFAIFFSLFYMFLYGFLHTEAICDVVDALYAKHNGKDPYEIIKKPDIGAVGMLYTVSFLILKLSTLCMLLINHFYFEFIAIAAISRGSILYIIYKFKFRSSFVSLLKESLLDKKIYTLFIVSFIYILILFFLVKFQVLALIFISFITSFIIVNRLKKELGFLNGDVLGFNIELNELVMMIYLVLFLTSF